MIDDMYTDELIKDVNWILGMDYMDALSVECRIFTQNEEDKGKEYARLAREFWVQVVKTNYERNGL